MLVLATLGATTLGVSVLGASVLAIGDMACIQREALKTENRWRGFRAQAGGQVRMGLI